MTIEERIAAAEAALSEKFRAIDAIAYHNQEKVLRAFKEERIALRHFAPSTGYGYGDEGRDALGRVYARVFGAERAVVSPTMLSGTHALTVALFGVLRPGDRVLCVSGMPYDTIRGVIWGEGNGSLKDFGISFECVPLAGDGKIDLPEAVTVILAVALSRKEKSVIVIQLVFPGHEPGDDGDQSCKKQERQNCDDKHLISLPLFFRSSA